MACAVGLPSSSVYASGDVKMVGCTSQVSKLEETGALHHICGQHCAMW